jgi:hypothetical protein
MLRTSFITAGALLIASSASAQQLDTSIKLKSTPKNAGTYHVATGTWTRANAPQANFGPTVVYDHSAPNPYYMDRSDGADITDAGRIPGSTDPNIAVNTQDLRNSYNVNGFQIGYCTSEGVNQVPPTEPDFTWHFYDNYLPCVNGGMGPDDTGVGGTNEGLNTNATLNSITNAFALPGTFVDPLMPGGPTETFACWIVTIDLEGTPDEFCFGADGGDDLFDNDASADSFGWELEVNNATNGPGGSFIAGDPAVEGEGTTFSAQPNIAGSGLGNADAFWNDDSAGTLGAILVPPMPTAPGCYFLGGFGLPQAPPLLGTNPFGGFHMVMFADTSISCDSTASLGTNFCVSAVNSATPMGGTTGSIMTATGSVSVAANDLVLAAGPMAGSQPGIFFYGTSQLNMGNGLPFGEGFRCAGGTVIRFFPPVVADPGGTLTLNLDNTYIPSATSSAPIADMATLHFQAWFRDPAGGGSGFNLSDALELTFTP